MITIITACFNSASTLAQTLASVDSQVGTTVEHLIIDGGSTDGSPDILRDRMPYRRVISEADKGMYDAMNKGIGLAKGDVVGILNADDIYASPDVLAKVAAIFEDVATDVCFGDLVYSDTKEPTKIVRYWRSGNFAVWKFYWGWMPPHPTFFVRKSIYEQFGVFRLQFGTAADYELMLRFLVKEKVSAAYIPEVLVRMRTGGVSNSSWKNRWEANRMDRRAWTINGIKPYPWTLWLKPLRKVGQWLLK
jgi:glycosyltransferase involved in cell wall biosynthesis